MKLTSFDELVSDKPHDGQQPPITLSSFIKIVKNAIPKFSGNTNGKPTDEDKPTNESEERKRAATTVQNIRHGNEDEKAGPSKGREKSKSNALPFYTTTLASPQTVNTTTVEYDFGRGRRESEADESILTLVRTRNELIKQQKLQENTMTTSSSRRRSKRPKSVPSIILMGFDDQVEFEKTLKGIQEFEAEEEALKHLKHTMTKKESSGENTLSALQMFVRKIRNFGNNQAKRDYWVRDEISTECYQCKLPFTTFRRKHHCRICGQVFCNNCAEITPARVLGTDRDLRVCDYCARIAREYNTTTPEDNVEMNYATINSTWRMVTPQSSISSSASMTTATTATASQQPQNSFENIRRLFTVGPSIFTSRFWSSAPNNAMDRMDRVEQEDKLPFRKDIEDEDHPGSDISEVDNSLVEFFSQNTLLQKKSGERSSDDQLQIEKSGRKQRGVGRGKYSANILRDQLNVLTSPFETFALSEPSSPMILSRKSTVASVSTDAPILTNEVDLKNPVVELSYETFEFMRGFLQKLIKEFQIDTNAGWDEIILSLIQLMCHNIRPNVKNGDNMDVQRYVKIKRLPGVSREGRYVQGIVVGRNVMHKKMKRQMKNPRILLLAFPLEYYRTTRQYMSLAPVLTQEREHLKNLVNSIVALKPDIVLVEKTVSRVALEFLLQEDLVVVCNMKMRVMESIARATNAEIVVSMEKITLKADARLGVCKSFQLETFIGNTGKTCMVFDGCLQDKYCTLLLTGPSMFELRKMKRILAMMCTVVYNLKLEYYLFKDQYCATNNPQQDETIPEADDVNLSLLSEQFEIPYLKAGLSISPGIKFPVPYLIRSMIECEARITIRIQELNRQELRGKATFQELSHLTIQHTLIKETIGEFLNCVSKSTLDQFYFAQQPHNDQLPIEVKRGLNYVMEHANHLLSPFNHQSLLVLYSNVNTLTSLPCHSPSILRIDYYKESDMTLGQYLEELCFDSNYLCPAETCQRPMLLHFRSYAHYNARLNVLIEEFQCPIQGMESTILMWSYCKICGVVSPVSPMSEWSLQYSFGKYLEQSFYHPQMFMRSEKCQHRINRDHVRYFGLKNTAVRFEYEMIDMFQVVPPILHLKQSEGRLRQLKQIDLDILRKAIMDYYQSLNDRLKNFPMVQIGNEDVRRELMALNRRIPNEKAKMLQTLQDRFLSTSSIDLLALNRIRKLLFDTCCQWDRHFADLIKKYLLPSNTGSLTNNNLLFTQKNQDQEHHWLLQFDRQGRDLSLLEDLPPLLISYSSYERWLNSASSNLNQSDLLMPILGSELSDSDGLEAETEDSEAVNALETAIQKAERESLNDIINERRSRFSTSFQSFRSSLHNNYPYSRRSPSRGSAQGSVVSSPARMDAIYSTTTASSSYVEPFIISGLFEESEFESDPTTAFHSPTILCKPLTLSQILTIDGDFVEDAFETSINDENESVEFLHEDIAKSPSLNTLEDPNERRSTIMSTQSQKSTNSLPMTVLGTELQLSHPPDRSSSFMKTLRDFTKWIQTTQGIGQSGQMMSLVGGQVSLLNEFVGLPALKYPFSITEHFIAECDLIIREDEPTSIVSFALSSKHYQEEIKRMRQVIINEMPSDPVTSTLANQQQPSEEVYVEESGSGNRRFTTISSSSKSSSANSPDLAEELCQKSIEHTLLKTAGTHIRYEFPLGTSKCSCSVYFAEQFDAIRRFCGCEDYFVQSMSRCVNWKATAGQSGSSFFKTADDRFFMKQLSKSEMEAFLRFAPSYFEYISQAFFHELPTVLVKLLGVYRIGYKSPENGRSRKIDVIVMENLFYGRTPSRIFDLKGSMRNRHVQATGKHSEVLLDENLVEIIGESPLFIREHSKKILRASVWNDTLFLSKLNVMDYSLLVGIDEQNHELVVGIVDFIRTFTWDKKLESWVKESGILGGGGKEPTIVSPRQYKSRFRESMDRYFLMVPDKFCNMDGLQTFGKSQ